MQRLQINILEFKQESNTGLISRYIAVMITCDLAFIFFGQRGKKEPNKKERRTAWLQVTEMEVLMVPVLTCRIVRWFVVENWQKVALGRSLKRWWTD